MKRNLLFGFCFITCIASAQIGVWTSPVRIVQGNENALHPAISDGFEWWSGGDELLAFSSNGKNICLLRTTGSGIAWPDSVVRLTSDSADNDYPSLVRSFAGYPNEQVMLLWQGRRNGALEILFSKYSGGSWNSPRQLTANGGDNRQPYVSLNSYGNDTTYSAVWERNGTIVFSSYSGLSWSTPELVSPAGDTLNHLPQVSFESGASGTLAFVVWQHRRANDTTCMILSSYKTGNIWKSPDTLVWNGDSRRPRYYKYNMRDYLTWDQVSGNNWTTFGGYLSIGSGAATLLNPGPLSNAAGNQRNSSVNGMMLITQSKARMQPHGVATWESPALDSIAVDLGFYGPLGVQRLSPPGAVGNRNPVISQGTIASGGGLRVRFWSVWESNVGGGWKLYGSNTVILIDGVESPSPNPEGFVLEQNYPNPFNPGTIIKYKIATAKSQTAVALKVFDVLGREVATLVNEVNPPGEYSVRFDASGLASGVYFYRLQAGSYVATRKLVVLR